METFARFFLGARFLNRPRAFDRGRRRRRIAPRDERVRGAHRDEPRDGVGDVDPRRSWSSLTSIGGHVVDAGERNSLSLQAKPRHKNTVKLARLTTATSSRRSRGVSSVAASGLRLSGAGKLAQVPTDGG